MRASGGGGRVVVGLVLAIVAFSCALIAVEAGLRIAGYRMPVLVADSLRGSYRIEPNATFIYYGYLPGAVDDFANPVRLNALGFHDRDYPAERPAPETYRIMVLGDSYVAALEVPLEQTFHKRLEARLVRQDPLGRGSYQVIAFGQGRTAQETEIGWARQYAPVYRPDLVLYVFFCGNDFMENDPETFAEASSFGERYLRKVVPRKIALFRRLLVFPRLRVNGLFAEAASDYYLEHLDRFDATITRADLDSPELGIYENPLSAKWAAAYERTGKLLDVARKEALQRQERFVLGSLSGPQAMSKAAERALWAEAKNPHLDYERPDRWVRDWAERHHVSHIELGPPLAAVGRRKLFWKHDQHLNPEGHAVVADLLYDYLVGVAKQP